MQRETVSSSVKSEERRVKSEVDSLREEISQNLEENLTEHEVITETVIYTIDCVEPAHARQTESELSSVLAQSQPSLKTVRVTERVRSRDNIARSKTKKEEVRVIRDTVVVEHRDTVIVEKTRGQTPAENRRAPWLSALRWIFWIIVAIGALIIIIKVTSFINPFKV